MPDRSALRAVQAADAELYANLRRSWWPQRVQPKQPVDLRPIFRPPGDEARR